MVFDYLLTCSTFLIGWIFPPFFMPFGFSLVWILLLKGINPWTMCFWMTIAGVLSYIPLWIIEWYILDTIGNNKHLFTRSPYLGRILEFFTEFFARQKYIIHSRKRVKSYVSTKQGKITLFFLALLFSTPVIPDIVNVSLFRKRLPFGVFLLAGFLGKLITFIPFVFLGKGLLELIF